MKVDHVLILAAGKGTRMGKIGEELPKVIWPIFDKSLLELQVLYAHEIAPHSKVFINLFNKMEKTLAHIEKNPKIFSDTEIIKEKKILDIGGAIHNLASLVGYKGNLLILNSDQFLMCEREVIEEGLKRLSENQALLYSYEVQANDGYNALDMENSYLKGIIKNENLDKNSLIDTYTGMSLINLDNLPSNDGESKFFETVANPTTMKVEVVKLKKFEYWDFGTLKRYVETIKRVLKEKDSLFYKFLCRASAISETKSLYKKEGYLVFGEMKIEENSIQYGAIFDET